MPNPRSIPPRALTVDIEDLTPAGDGFARFRTGTLTVPGTIPGERVRVRLAPGGARRTQPVEAELLESVLRSVAVRVGQRTSETAATVVVSANTDKRLRTATQRWLASQAAAHRSPSLATGRHSPDGRDNSPIRC